MIEQFLQWFIRLRLKRCNNARPYSSVHTAAPPRIRRGRARGDRPGRRGRRRSPRAKQDPGLTQNLSLARGDRRRSTAGRKRRTEYSRKQKKTTIDNVRKTSKKKVDQVKLSRAYPGTIRTYSRGAGSWRQARASGGGGAR